MPDEVTVWVTFEEQSAVLILDDVDLLHAFVNRVRKQVLDTYTFIASVAGQVVPDLLIKHGDDLIIASIGLLSLIWLQNTIEDLIQSGVSSLHIDLTKLRKIHVIEIVGFDLLLRLL